MSNAENLRAIYQNIQVSGKFERNEFLAVRSNLIDIADRLEKVEREHEQKSLEVTFPRAAMRELSMLSSSAAPSPKLPNPATSPQAPAPSTTKAS